MTTKIEWVQGAHGERGMTWNPIRGCSRISPGCGGGGSYSGTAGQRGGCYAEGIAARFSGPGQPFHGFAEMTEHGPRWTGKVALVPEKLAEPLHRKKPTTWFLSMFDPFHEALTNEEIAALFGVMAACPQHTFQVLTKRAERLPCFFGWVGSESDRLSGRPSALLCGVEAANHGANVDYLGMPDIWPLSNVWLGASVEDQKRKARIDHLRSVPAAVRFLSLEPLLEDLGELDLAGIHQVIAGAESGPGARPMWDDWVRSIRDQAKAQGVKMFFKQKLDARGHKVSLPLLDGKVWAEMPARTVAP
jgi:protein gp37